MCWPSLTRHVVLWPLAEEERHPEDMAARDGPSGRSIAEVVHEVRRERTEEAEQELKDWLAQQLA